MKEVKMRRYQNLLTVSGLGVIMFGVWSVLRTILLLFFQQNAVSQVFHDESVTVRILSYTILAVMLLADSLSRLFVGLSARAEGFGKKKGYAYIVFAVFLALFSLLSLAIIVFDNSTLKNSSLMEIVVSFIVEVTSLVVSIELLVAAFTVKKLTKELGEVS